jgi:hypothetical protein
MSSISRRDWQEMGVDNGLLTVGQIRSDEAIAGERFEVENVVAGLHVGNQ